MTLTHVGYQLRCDTGDCSWKITRDTSEEALSAAEQQGWETVEQDFHFCPSCVVARAARKRPSEIVPEGVTVRTIPEGAKALGWDCQDDGDAFHLFCECGTEVQYTHFLGSVFQASCDSCNTSLEDVTGPVFGNSHVTPIDSSKVVVEDPCRWISVKDGEAV